MLSIPEKKSYLLKNKIILKKLALKRFNYNFFKIKKGGFTYPMQKWLNTSDSNQNKFMDKDKFLQMKFDHINKNREFRNFFHCNKVLSNFI